MPTEFLLRFNGSFADSSPRNRAFTASGTPTILQSAVDSAQYFGRFSSQSAYLTTPTDTNIEIRAQAFTFQTWIWPNIATGTPIYSRGSGTWGITYEYAFFWDTNYLYFYHGIRGTNQSQIRWPIPDKLLNERWYFLTWQRDSSGQWSAYVNGVELPQYQYAPLAGTLNFGALTTGRLTNAVDLGTNTLRHRIHGFDAHSFGGTEHTLYEDIELVVGESLYTGTFTPPATPAEPFFPIARLVRLNAEALSVGDPTAALSRLVVESLSTSDVPASLGRITVEVLSSNASKKSRPTVFLIT